MAMKYKKDKKLTVAAEHELQKFEDGINVNCVDGTIKVNDIDVFETVMGIVSNFDKWVKLRVILFRGKRGDNKKLVYGFYWFIKSHCDEKLSGKHFIKSINNGIDYEVIPETVGQFIGREDMNRNKIFKDDLLSTKERDVLFQVVWNNESCGFKFKSIETGTLFEIDSSVEKLEVIGNIHE